jgi:dinuclear metal center YbgI/SA1388 family protein
MILRVEGKLMQRDALTRELDRLLQPEHFRDYSPNGLQVQGRAEIHRVVTGVSASLALIDAALAVNADAILVHHGWFWRGEDPRLLGFRRERMARLLAANLNLYAYHLPLDAHAQLGNNAGLARALGFTETGRCGEQDLLCYGSDEAAGILGDLAARVTRCLGRAPLCIGEPSRPVQRVAWCTGAAQSLFETALNLGVDVFLSGEISEQHVHLARESGVAYLACGHHATERFGVQSLAAWLTSETGVTAQFIDIDSPV